MLAHGVHYALVVAGLAGLGSLLALPRRAPAMVKTEPEADAEPTERAPG